MRRLEARADGRDRRMAKTILHVFGRMNRGGAETRTLEVLRRLDPSEFRLHFCAFSGLPGDLDDEIVRLGHEVHHARTLPRFARLLAELRPDVVHSHVHMASGAFVSLARLAGVPTRITHFRSTGDGQRSTRARRLRQALLRRAIDRCSTHIVGVTDGVLREAWRPDWRSDPRCSVIYNAVDVERLKALPCRTAFSHDAAPALIHVGNVTPAKNHLRLLSIFDRLLTTHPRAQLVLIGAGTEELKAAHCPRTSEVVALGPRDCAPAYMRAASALVLPSSREGLPGVVLEAAASGVPVVASDLPGVIDVQRLHPYPRAIQTVPLAASDETWIAAIMRATLDWTTSDRQEAARAFEATPFTVHRAKAALELVWRAARARASQGRSSAR